VDTIGFNDINLLDHVGLPHSEALHVTSAIRRVDHDTLQNDFTIEDPKAYTKPWTAQQILQIEAGLGNRRIRLRQQQVRVPRKVGGTELGFGVATLRRGIELFFSRLRRFGSGSISFMNGQKLPAQKPGGRYKGNPYNCDMVL